MLAKSPTEETVLEGIVDDGDGNVLQHYLSWFGYVRAAEKGDMHLRPLVQLPRQGTETCHVPAQDVSIS